MPAKRKPCIHGCLRTRDCKVCLAIYHRDYRKQDYVIERHNRFMIEYRQRSEVKQMNAQYKQTPEQREAQREYRERPEVKQRENQLVEVGFQSPMIKPRIVKRKTYYRIIQANKNPLLYWAKTSLSTHKQKGHVIAITKEQLYEFAIGKDNCPLCNIKFEFNPYGTGKKPGPNNRRATPSLDRINNEKIITLDNIQILCFKCNMIKSDRTMQEFIDYCRIVADKFKT